jgi:hypothetical protein
MTNWKIYRAKGVDVHYLPHLDGGGSTFGRQFLPLLKYLIKPVPVAFEWCCGPAFIGFSLLGHGVCKKLFLSDANPAAENAVRRTVHKNGLGKTVKFFLRDTVDALPRLPMLDLVVANPPHFNQCKGNRLADDQNWRVHREFFECIHSRLRPNADVFLQENFMGAPPHLIVRLANYSKLSFVNVFTAKSADTNVANVYYFLHFKPKNERVSVVHQTPKTIIVDIKEQGCRVQTVPADQLIRFRFNNQTRTTITVNLFSPAWMRLMKTYTVPRQSSVLTHILLLGKGNCFLADCNSKTKVCLFDVY